MTEGPVSYWSSFWLCFVAMVARPGQLVRQLWFPVAWTLAVFVVMVFFVQVLGVGIGKPDAVRVSGGAVAKGLVQKIVDWDNRPSERHAHLSLVVEGPPARVLQVVPFLRKEGLQVVEPGLAVPQVPAARLRWEESRWQLTSAERGWALLLWPSVSAAVEKSRGAERLPEGFLKLSDGNFVDVLRREHRQWSDNLVPMLVLLPLLLSMGLLFIKTYSHVEQARSEGLLEALALARQPFWIYMLAYCLAQGIQYVAVIMSVLVLVGALVKFMAPLSMLCFALAGACLATCLSCLGFSTVFFWKTQMGRLLGLALATPLGIGLVTFWVVGSVTARGAPSSMRGVALLERSPSECVGLLLGAVVCALLVCPLACAFVQWRVGTRWEGMGRG